MQSTTHATGRVTAPRLGLAPSGRDTWISSPLAGALAAGVVALLATLAAEGIHRLTGSTRFSSGYLLGVSYVAYRWGSAPALLSAALGVAGFFVVAQPDPPAPFIVNNLLAFGGAAVAVGFLASRLRRQTRMAEARRRQALQVAAATQRLGSLASGAEIRRELLDQLTRLGGRPAIEGASVRDLCDRAGLMRTRLLDSYAARTPPLAGGHTIAGWAVRDLRAGDKHYGAVAWRLPEEAVPETLELGVPADDALGSVLVDVAAQSLARVEAPAP